MNLALTNRERRALVALLAIAVLARLATLGAYPLMDPTEARYAEIARKMLESGDWLVPQVDYGIAFWGKPPLSMWWTAASMAVFGVNEFAARLPSFMAMVLSGALVGALAWLRAGRDHALWAIALFATVGFVFVTAGATMTDPALVLGTTLSMSGFWIAGHGPARFRRIAGWGFFVGLAVGLLAKGPVAAVLIFVPLAIATVVSRSWRKAWRDLPWVVGTVLAVGVSGVWYWAADQASPGFLQYFVIGEHWKRFTEPGWRGDLYGMAHSRTHGTIWLMWFVAALPWSIVAIIEIGRALAGRRERLRLVADPWRLYLLAWATAPMLFFTFAGNVLIAYVLPGLPAFALLLADLWHPARAAEPTRAWPRVRTPVRDVLAAAALVPAIFVVGIVVMNRSLETERSQKALIRDFERVRATPQARVIFFREHPPSGDFYSRGTALKAMTLPALEPYLVAGGERFFAIRTNDLYALSASERSKLQWVGSYGDYRLLRADGPLSSPDPANDEGDGGE